MRTPENVLSRLSVAVFLLICSSSLLYAQSLPDLNHQNSWGQTEKSEFLKYLHSGQSAPISGEVRQIPALAEPIHPLRKARYVTLNLATDTVFAVAGDGRVLRQPTAVGPKILVGGHLFSWMRCYTGAEYTRFLQDKMDGSRARVHHWQVPFGLELALIPLGTPQTRYVILRGGMTLHYFSSSTDKSQFSTPLLGLQGAWNVGLGYEWQLENTPLRIHALAEGYRSLIRNSSASFYGLGFNTGFVYTF